MRKTFITSEDIKDDDIRPEDVKNSGTRAYEAFLKFDRYGNSFVGQPGRIPHNPPQVRSIEDAVGVSIPYGALFQKMAILDGMPDLFLYAHKKYEVTVKAGETSLYSPYLFDGRGNSALLVNPTQEESYPILIEIVHTNQIVHGDCALLVFHDWRYSFSKTSYGGKLIDWTVEVLNFDTGEWENVLSRSGADDSFPFVFTVGNIRVQGIRITITKAQGATWASTLLYLTGFSLYYTGGGTPWDAVGAISLAGGRIYGSLGFHEDATIEVAGEYTLSTTRDLVDGLRWNNDVLEMHKLRLKFKRGFLVSVEDLGWQPVPKM